MTATPRKEDQVEEAMLERDLEVDHDITVEQDLNLKMDNATM